MSSQTLLHVADGFWNIRDSFRLAGLFNIGTHASLARQRNGAFVLIDACTLSDTVAQEIDRLTNDGRDIEAMLHVHPFHTVHVREMHERYPHAKLYGTTRHASQLPDLPWEEFRTEDVSLHAMFAEDFEFSVPAGVDFVSHNSNVHFSSVLVLHRSSQTIHVDDTLLYIRLPDVCSRFGLVGILRFHPTLPLALVKRAGAAQEFRQWAAELTQLCLSADNLVAAHRATLLKQENKGISIKDHLAKALEKVEPRLEAHARKYG